ncbi:MAG: GNAT family N-acetyltransferase [Bryobacteraceae bacterium]|jgi:tagatose 1,6-diphosphate aldolase
MPPGTGGDILVSNELVHNETGAFRFLEPGELRDDDVSLRLVATHPADPTKNWVPYYVLHIVSAKTGRRAGEIHLRIGNTEHMRLYGGHVAYGVRPEFRGNHFAARALRLLMPLARRHGLSELWITCNPENVASRRTCELAGAELTEIVDLPPHVDMYQEGERQKCRYRLDLLTGE